jgi:hypothetical protein
MRTRRSAAPWITTAILGLVLVGCAGLDERAVAETHRLDEAPYYVDVGPRPAPGVCAAVLPVTLDPELKQVLGYGDRLQRFEPILAALNARIAERKECVRSARATIDAAQVPRVYVGTSDGELAPMEAESQRLSTDRFPPMVLHLERPGPQWRVSAAEVASTAGTPYVISAQLGISQYGKGYRGVWRKEVKLGTGYFLPVKFLSADDKPVDVLHLTGLLLDSSGKPVRAGAEGIIARDTPFVVQVFEASKVLDDLALDSVVRDERREDLSGAPLALDVALDNLLAQLTLHSPQVPAR